MAVVERVEGVEEFFLGLRLVGEELDVVDHQDVDAAMLLAEGADRTVLDAVDEAVGELLTAQVQHPAVGVRPEDGVADRLQQVSLAEADVAVHEERVVGPPRVGADRQGGGVGQPVAVADHEFFEHVVVVERAVPRRGRNRARLRSQRRLGIDGRVDGLGGRLPRHCRHGLVRRHLAVRRVGDADAWLAAGHRLDDTVQDFEVVARDPVTQETVGDREHHLGGANRDQIEVSKPCFELLLAESRAKVADDVVQQILLRGRILAGLKRRIHGGSKRGALQTTPRLCCEPRRSWKCRTSGKTTTYPATAVRPGDSSTVSSSSESRSPCEACSQWNFLLRGERCSKVCVLQRPAPREAFCELLLEHA